MFDLDEFLLMREKRVEVQNFIIKKFQKPIIVLRANYPGEDKNDFLAHSITEIIRKEIDDIFNKSIIFVEKILTVEGLTYIFSVDSCAEKLKEISITIEETHLLGRYVDIDVFSENGYAFSRSDFGGTKRKCFICENLAFICGRSNAHTHEEIKKVIRKKYEFYSEFLTKQENISDIFSNKALKAIVLEVSSFPSFGLVTPLTSGAHTDMDFFTFLDSSFALTSYLKKVAKAGYSSLPLDLILKKIRFMGMVAEEEMFIATNNINTHKGMIFLMGITVACAAKAKFLNLSFNSISFLISEMCSDILKDFENLENKENLTHGEKLFIEHKILGVRGIVKNGLDFIFKEVLDVFSNSFSKEKNINFSMIRTLIFIMSRLEDTTILHRHNFDTLTSVQIEAQNLHSKFKDIALDISFLTEIEKEYSDKKISPGGAADLLAVTIFLDSIKNLY